MRTVIILIMLLSGFLAYAEVNLGNSEPGKFVSGEANTTYLRLEDDRFQIIESLKKITDENASQQCVQNGYSKANRFSDYKIKETYSNSYAYISIIKISADYICPGDGEELKCYGRTGGYKYCE